MVRRTEGLRHLAGVGLVARTVYWVDPDLFVPALGALEMFVGLMLLVGRAMRLTLFLFVAQVVGTFRRGNWCGISAF